LTQKYRPQDLVVLAVNSWNEDHAALRGFAEKEGLAQRLLLDGEGVAGEYGVTSVPTSFFVDRLGTIQDVELGFGGPAPMERRIKSLLEAPQ